MKSKRVIKAVTFLALFVLLSFAASADEYEDDDNYTDASWIDVNGTEQFHLFDDSGDADWVKFNATPGYYYVMQTRNYSNINITDTVIAFYDDDGTTVRQVNDDEESPHSADGGVRTSKIVGLINGTGPYFINITNWNNSVGGNYSISVEQQGNLTPALVSPLSNINAVQNKTFSFTAIVECAGGPCRNVSLALDPPSKAKLFNEKQIEKVLAENGSVNVIVKLRDDGNVYGKKEKIKKNQDVFIASASKFKLKRKYTTVFNGVSGSVDAQGLEELLNNGNVEAVYYDMPVKALLSESVPHINGTSVWSMQANGTNITGEGQTICILDTGINYNHSDFGGANGFPSAKVIGGYDYVNDDADPLDDHGHGTHVAGIAAGENDTYRGVAYGARIVAIKVLDNAGDGTSDDIIAGIDWCVNNASAYNITVISMSLGSDTQYNLPCDSDDSLTSSINAAASAGIAVVAASGNYDPTPPYYPGIVSPACISKAISVGATERSTDSIAGYTKRDYFLDILAPGSNIMSTDYDGTHVQDSGTSMATPHIAGVVALIQQYNNLSFGRQATTEDIRYRLKTSGIIIDDASTTYSFPRVDAYDAVSQKGIIPNVIGASPFYVNSSNPYDCGDLEDGENCTATWYVNATGDIGTQWEFFVIAKSDVWFNTSSSVYVNITPKMISSVNLLLNGTSGNLSSERTGVVNITAEIVDGEFVYVLENGTVIGSNNTNFTILRQYNSNGIFNITLLHNETENYYESSETFFITVNDTKAPSITVTSPANSTTLTYSYLVNLSFTAGEAANCSYSFDEGGYIELGIGTSFLDTLEEMDNVLKNSAHNITLNCTDNYSNTKSIWINFTVNDVTAPVVTDSDPSGTISDNTPTLKIYTNEPAICRFDDSDDSYDDLTDEFDITNSTYSRHTLDTLANGDYDYYAKCKDRQGNKMTTSKHIEFTVSVSTSSGGGGGSSCSNECSNGQIECADYNTLRWCEFDIRTGCWVWGWIDCDGVCEDEACVAGECVEDWICEPWASCSGGMQTRDCVDLSACGTYDRIPLLEQSCSEGAEAAAGEENLGVQEASAATEMPVDASASAGNRTAFREKLGEAVPVIVLFIIVIVFAGFFILIAKYGAEIAHIGKPKILDKLKPKDPGVKELEKTTKEIDDLLKKGRL
ncbi:S8 family serine peptidase [Candidatus Woesearchaeota archaeon]|nr:S8 family serine peptidase [Candidatus Woesearchaeota archaeon]